MGIKFRGGKKPQRRVSGQKEGLEEILGSRGLVVEAVR